MKYGVCVFWIVFGVWLQLYPCRFVPHLVPNPGDDTEWVSYYNETSTKYRRSTRRYRWINTNSNVLHLLSPFKYYNITFIYYTYV